MRDNLNFEVFLFFSPEKIILSVNRKTDFVSVFNKEFFINEKFTHLDFEKLNFFLNENIFKIEKTLGNFIEKVNLIIKSSDLFNLQLSIKKNDYNKKINLNTISSLLKDAKYQCNNTIHKNKIIHILIDNYIIDNHSYTELPLNQKCESFSLDISFICIPEVIVGKIQDILKTYQITLNNIVSSKYIERYLNDESVNYFHMVSKIIDGHNKNEFKITNKTSKNRGFFEKFFNLFG